MTLQLAVRKKTVALQVIDIDTFSDFHGYYV